MDKLNDENSRTKPMENEYDATEDTNEDMIKDIDVKQNPIGEASPEKIDYHRTENEISGKFSI